MSDDLSRHPRQDQLPPPGALGQPYPLPPPNAAPAPTSKRGMPVWGWVLIGAAILLVCVPVFVGFMDGVREGLVEGDTTDRFRPDDDYWRSEWNLIDERDRAHICEAIQGDSLDEVTDWFVASAKGAGTGDLFTRDELRHYAIWVRNAGCK